MSDEPGARHCHILCLAETTSYEERDPAVVEEEKDISVGAQRIINTSGSRVLAFNGNRLVLSPRGSDTLSGFFA